MIIEQQKWQKDAGWQKQKGDLQGKDAQMVLVFGDSAVISAPGHYESLRSLYPRAKIVGCSTSGNILGTEVLDDCLTATAVHLERTQIRMAHASVSSSSQSYEVGMKLRKHMDDGSLRHLFILSEGLNVNGSELAKGLNAMDNNRIAVTGGLAGDSSAFSKTWVMANSAAVSGQIAALGFYGDSVNVSYGCVHGWENFGVNRTVTRSESNVVYEIDNEPALALYRRYLGPEFADKLPASGLRFPISVQLEEGQEPVVRTLLAVDEEKQSLTFAGDVPEGKVVLLMKTNMDGLIEAAEQAAKNAKLAGDRQGLAIAVSCVGRRLVLSKQTEEEVESVQETLGDNFYLTGYYSYGELAPFADLIKCQLHNQTMTLTTISE